MPSLFVWTYARQSFPNKRPLNSRRRAPLPPSEHLCRCAIQRTSNVSSDPIPSNPKIQSVPPVQAGPIYTSSCLQRLDHLPNVLCESQEGSQTGKSKRQGFAASRKPDAWSPEQTHCEL